MEIINTCLFIRIYEKDYNNFIEDIKSYLSESKIIECTIYTDIQNG